MHTPGRGDGALRRNRISLAGSSYFLSLCSANRVSGMNRDQVVCALRLEISAIETNGHRIVRAGAIMPDHLHLLIRLTGDMTLSRCVARLKAKTRNALAPQNLAWQQNFYEHRLRPGDTVEEVLRYIFLNPYRGGLVTSSQTYDYFWLGADELSWFKPLPQDRRPIADWLR